MNKVSNFLILAVFAFQCCKSCSAEANMGKITATVVLGLLAKSGSSLPGKIIMARQAPGCQNNDITILGTPLDGKKTYYAISHVNTNFGFKSAKEACECQNLQLATIQRTKEAIPQSKEWEFLMDKSTKQIISNWYWVAGRDSQKPSQFIWDSETDPQMEQIDPKFPFSTFDLPPQTCLLYLASSSPKLVSNLCNSTLPTAGVLCQMVQA